MFPPPILLAFLALYLLPSSTKSQFTNDHNCENITNYGTGSTFETNLKLLFSSLIQNTPKMGFLNNTIGSIPDRVYGSSLRRGDINASDCTSCLSTVSQDLIQLCPYDRGAIIWYEGILPNGQEVAVKRLSQNSSQGLGELRNELVLVAKLQHKNLVRVVGVCLEGQEKLLVYEFVPNRSLDTFLFENEKRQELDWRKRWIIINGVARGLQYLHEESRLTIIHRDLKASNILLDSDLNPKISDFGLARMFHVDQTTNVTGRVVGTFGYMAPEYAMQGLYSIKSDVFSFGVLLLEIVTGRRNNGSFHAEHGKDLLSFAWEHWTTGTITDMMDPLIDCPTNEMIRHINIGLLCVQEDPMDRPRMSEVVIMISSNTISLRTPSKPAFYLGRGGGSNSQSVSGDRSLQNLVPVSHNEVSISEFEPR